jgi:hypothetical protein
MSNNEHLTANRRGFEMGDQLNQAIAIELFLKLLDPNRSDEENIARTKKILDAFKPQPAGFTTAQQDS